MCNLLKRIAQIELNTEKTTLREKDAELQIVHTSASELKTLSGLKFIAQPPQTRVNTEFRGGGG